MARNHTDITQLEEVDMREVAQKPCLNLEGIIEESCLEPINSDDYWLFKCRIEDYRNRRCPLCKGTAVHSHGDYGKPRLIHDVNVGKKRVDILLKVKRYLCDSCEKTFTNIPECILENRQMTDRLFENLFGILSPRWRKNTVIPSPLSLLYSTTTARSWRPSAAQSLRHGYSVSTKNTL